MNIEKERGAILAGASLFSEKLINDDRFSQSGGAVGSRATPVQKDQGEGSGTPPTASAGSGNGRSGIPAGQQTPTQSDSSDPGSGDESSSDGGMLREIKLLESPDTVHMDGLSFGRSRGQTSRSKQKRKRLGREF